MKWISLVWPNFSGIYLHSSVWNFALTWSNWTNLTLLFLNQIFFLSGSAFARDCNIPLTLRGTWFYRENRVYHTTEINADSMSGRGYCVASNSSAAEYNMVFKEDTSSCYHCVKFYVRTVNILEKVECKFCFFLISLNLLFIKK